jgi:hypothetical protein
MKENGAIGGEPLRIGGAGALAGVVVPKRSTFG